MRRAEYFFAGLKTKIFLLAKNAMYIAGIAGLCNPLLHFCTVSTLSAPLQQACRMRVVSLSLFFLQVLEKLQTAIAEVLQGRALKVKLQGLNFMNEDPSSIHVLYFNVKDVDEKDSSQLAGLKELQQIADIAVGALREEDLLLPTDDR